MPGLYVIPDLIAQTSAVLVFNQVPLATMAKAQCKDSVLDWSFHTYVRGLNQRAQLLQKLGAKQHRNICCNVIDWYSNKVFYIGFTSLMMLNHTKIVLLLEYHEAVLHMLHDDYGHQGFDQTLALVRERLYWSMMNHDTVEYVTNCHQCHVSKGHYTGVHTQQGFLVANNPLDLLCIDFLKVDPSREGKDNILVLTDAFTKFSQAFITNNQKALTISKILVEK